MRNCSIKAATVAVGVAAALLACLVFPVSAKGSKSNFTGAWSVENCDKADPGRECGSFSLYLVQDGDRICGQHFVATPGLSKLDEGDLGAVLGTFEGNKAVLVIKSARNDALYLATAQIAKGSLRWHRVGMVAAGEDAEPSIIPASQSLTRDLRDAYLQHLEKVKAAPCLWPDGDHGKTGASTAKNK